MKPTEFIIAALKEFILNFTQTHVRYEFDSSINTHYIEVVPNSVYHLDDEYIKWETSFFEIFITNYPEQNICFISDDALVGLDEIQFELFGGSYVEYSVNKDCNYIPLKEISYNEQISNSKISIYSVFEGLGSYSVNSISEFNISCNKPMINIFDLNGCLVNIVPGCNEEHYPLAA